MIFCVNYLTDDAPSSLYIVVPAVQAEDIRALFSLLVIWMAIIRSGWVLPPRTVRELQPLTSQLSLHGYDQLVIDPTHARGGTFDLLMTGVPDL